MKSIRERDIIKGMIVQRKQGGIYFCHRMIGYKQEDNNYFDLISKKSYKPYNPESNMKDYNYGFYATGIKHPFKKSLLIKKIKEQELNSLVDKYILEFQEEQEKIKNQLSCDEMLLYGNEKIHYTDDPVVNELIIKDKTLYLSNNLSVTK